MIKTILFDLDGTLLNTIDDLADAANWVCTQHGWPTFPVETYKHFVGNGIPKLVERFSPENARTPEQLAATLAEFSARYDAHKEELDAFNKAVRTLMKLNGSTAVDFSALDAEFSALQSSSAELHTQLETLQPDISALKNIRKYIDMVLNKQQLSTPGGKPPEKESVLKQLEQLQQLQQKKSNYKTISTTPNREESL